ncbi:MAG: hypothetical protein CMJ53_02425 [Planctomycetaceae bacterium]|nr:hypothetical protein [Planctomycetaceae bacterium]
MADSIQALFKRHVKVGEWTEPSCRRSDEHGAREIRSSRPDDGSLRKIMPDLSEFLEASHLD